MSGNSAIRHKLWMITEQRGHYTAFTNMRIAVVKEMVGDVQNMLVHIHALKIFMLIHTNITNMMKEISDQNMIWLDIQMAIVKWGIIFITREDSNLFKRASSWCPFE